MALSEQRLNQLNARAVDIETRLRGKEVELAQTRTQFTQLTADFRYNLKLLEDRDAELARLDSTVAVHRAACDKAEHNLAHARGLVNEKDAELRRQKNRVGELEAYHAEKVERLRKQTDEARYARDDALQRQKDDFSNLERQLVRQVEEQKAAIELDRKETVDKNEQTLSEKSLELEIPINNLRRELSDEKAQTLALASELEAWRQREENTRKELAKSTQAKRAAEANAVEVYEKLTETETTVLVLRGEVAELRAFKELAPEKAEERVNAAMRDYESKQLAKREEEYKKREAETDRLRAKIKMLEKMLEGVKGKTRGASSSSASKSLSKQKGSASKTPRRVTIREASSSSSDASAAASSSESDSESEDSSPVRRRKKKHETPPPGRRNQTSPSSTQISAPPSIGREKGDAALAAAEMEMERKIKTRNLLARGDDPYGQTVSALVSSSQVERMWRALPPRVSPQSQPVQQYQLSREDIEIAAMRAVEAALLRSGKNVALGVKENPSCENVSPRTKLERAKTAVLVSSSSAPALCKLVTKKTVSKAKPKPPPVRSGPTFGPKRKAPSSLAAVEAREARLLRTLEDKVAALSGGRTPKGRSAIRKALR